LTRAELAIMREHASCIAKLLGPDCLVIEFGSGSSVKTRLLLDQLSEPAGYMPIDISGEHLDSVALGLIEDYPSLEVVPVCADFTRPLDLPPLSRPAARRIVYFPGSTIGNFMPAEAARLLRRAAELAGAEGGMILGADLKKDPSILQAAYNDRRGITAAFNRNILVRINRELGGDFQIDGFWHHAFYNPVEGRIEVHLVSRKDQRAHLGGEEFCFAEGESIRTECSYKYSSNDLRHLASAAGFDIHTMWFDQKNRFSVLYLTLSSR
jgi:dimethylhistidine N-methyltransferase